VADKNGNISLFCFSPMKILIVHTYYQQKGGEDAIFQQECNLLSETEEVKGIHFHNKGGWKGALMFLVSIWNIGIVSKIKKEIKEFKPDVIHIHNWHFAIGPQVIRMIGKSDIPLVLTLHNFRLLCPSGTLLHNGKLVTESVKAKFPWNAIRSKVYRNSVIQTFWLAFIVWLHRKIGTWKLVTRFIVNTNFSKSLHEDSTLNLQSDRFVVNPNFLYPPVKKDIEREKHFLFVGRLAEEKGITILLTAFEKSGYQLHIAGDGPLKQLVEENCRKNFNIQYLGRLDKEEVLESLQNCTALVFPSIWFEGMPMTIIESFAVGTPVIASNLGAMASMIKNGYNGLHFEAGNVNDLLQQLHFWSALPEEEKQQYYLNSVKDYEETYSPRKIRDGLLTIYQSAIREKTH
jgi:glycosyltransferase involved in cell wall biosynthesis